MRQAGSSAPPTPPPPTALVATAVSSSRIDLMWSDNSANETGFVIERCQGAGCNNFAAARAGGRQHDQLQQHRAHGVDQLLVSGRGDQRRRHLRATRTRRRRRRRERSRPPPSSLTRSAVSASQINLTWSDNAANETGFVIERCQGAGCNNFAVARRRWAPTSTSYNNTGLAASTSYSYRVAATNGAGTSAYSNTTVGDDAGHDSRRAPSSLSASAVSASQINLTWSDNAANETGFVIERCQGAGCNNFAVAHAGGRQHDQLQQHRARGVDQLLVSGRGDQRRRHLRATRTRRRRRRRARLPAAPSSLTAVGGVGEPDQPDLERQRGERDRLRH